MSTAITYGGFNINDGTTYITMSLTKELGKTDTDLITIPGRDGAVAGATSLQPIVISCDIVIGNDPDFTVSSGMEKHMAQFAALAKLTAALADPAVLVMPGLGNYYGRNNIAYNAIASGGTLETYQDGLIMRGVTFTVPEGVGFWHGYFNTRTGKFDNPSSWGVRLERISVDDEQTWAATGYPIEVQLEYSVEEDDYWRKTGIVLLLTPNEPQGASISRITFDFARRAIQYYTPTESGTPWRFTFADVGTVWEPDRKLDPAAQYRVTIEGDVPNRWDISAIMLDVI